jgi:excinuclease ABC subunit C
MTQPPDTTPATGHEVIHAYLRTLDNSPGVYRMLDTQSPWAIPRALRG